MVRDRSLRQADQKYLVRESPPENLQIVRSDESFLYDSKGKRYIDFAMGWCVGNLGWGRKEIKDEIRRFKGPDYVYPEYMYRPWVDLAKLLAQITPGKLKKSFRATGGTEAVDLALQAAMAHTGRRGFVSIEDSYHGDSIGRISIASSDYKKQFKNLLPNCHKIEPPLDRKAVDKVRTILKRRQTAAFIMEPVICNLNVLIPEHEFMEGVQDLCRKHGTLLIMDEVATGFGRTGKLFASEHFGIEPDILCMAKAISGGFAGLGATITTNEVADSIEDSSYYSTYGWHPLSVQATLANIKYILKHKTELLKNVNAMSMYFQERLSQMKFRHRATIHMKGLAIGVEFNKSDYAVRLQAKCKKEGLLFVTSGETGFTLFPALNIRRSVAQQGLDLLERCL